MGRGARRTAAARLARHPPLAWGPTLHTATRRPSKPDSGAAPPPRPPPLRPPPPQRASLKSMSLPRSSGWALASSMWARRLGSAPPTWGAPPWAGGRRVGGRAAGPPSAPPRPEGPLPPGKPRPRPRPRPRAHRDVDAVRRDAHAAAQPERAAGRLVPRPHVGLAPRQWRVLVVQQHALVRAAAAAVAGAAAALAGGQRPGGVDGRGGRGCRGRRGRRRRAGGRGRRRRRAVHGLALAAAAVGGSLALQGAGALCCHRRTARGCRAADAPRRPPRD
jgi:hypothetical protein